MPSFSLVLLYVPILSPYITLATQNPCHTTGWLPMDSESGKLGYAVFVL